MVSVVDPALGCPAIRNHPMRSAPRTEYRQPLLPSRVHGPRAHAGAGGDDAEPGPAGGLAHGRGRVARALLVGAGEEPERFLLQELNSVNLIRTDGNHQN